MMRYFLSFLIYFSCINSAHSQNSLPNLERISSSYKTSLRKFRPKLYQTGAKASKKTGQAVAHQGQALLLILMLTGVDLVKESLELAKVRKENVDTAVLLKHSKEAAEHILLSGEIWSSIIGAGVTTGALSKPISFFQEAIQSTKARPILKDLLSNGIATMSLFIGWELGGQLFTEAREMLEDDDDYNRSDRFMLVLLNSIKSKIHPNQKELQSDVELLQKLMGNIVKILVSNHELRNLWLYNTFRTRIATGEFVTLVSSMVGATTVGTAIFPGVGTLGGLCFGLAGGFLSLYIPQDQKDMITSGLQNLREAFWMSGRESHGLTKLMNHQETVVRISADYISRNEDLPPMLNFKNNPHSTNKILSIYFEKIHRLESRLQSTRAMKAEALKHNNTEAFEKYSVQGEKISEDYLNVLNDLSQIYSSEVKHWKELFEKYGYQEYLNNRELSSKYSIIRNVKDHYERVVLLEGFISEDLISTIKSEMQLSVDKKSYFNAVQRFYIFGYDEDEVFKLVSE